MPTSVRTWLIDCLLACLARLGWQSDHTACAKLIQTQECRIYELSTQLHAAETKLDFYSRTIDNLGKKPPTRELEDRLNVIYTLIDGLLPEVRRIDLSPQSGEWKRHKVYSYGLRHFPRHRKDDIGFAVELALRKHKRIEQAKEPQHG